MRNVIVVIVALLSTGCTSMYKAFSDDPVRATIITGENKRAAIATVSLDASRRNVVVVLTGNRIGQFCAEPPPDTASAIESILEAEAKAKGEIMEKKSELDGKLKDTYKSAVVVIAKRTELLDIYRTGTYSLCQYYLNDAIGKEELGTLFENLTDKVLSRIPEASSEERK